MRLFILNPKGLPVPAPNITIWADHIKKRGLLKLDVIDLYTVSTGFLGVTLQEGDNPYLFETIVLDQSGTIVFNVRYQTKEDAESGHSKAVDLARDLANA